MCYVLCHINRQHITHKHITHIFCPSLVVVVSGKKRKNTGLRSWLFSVIIITVTITILLLLLLFTITNIVLAMYI
jgi:hypothetical protein